MAIVYLALGSNVGDRHSNIQQAIEGLNAAGILVECVSTVIETEPVGGPPQDKFLNAVLKGQTELSPDELLRTTQLIEKKLRRVKTVADGPRTIDIDILLYDSLRLETPTLTIPHPRMFHRDFVMRPLKEIAPEIIKELF